jgi:hypothetical protein
MRRLFIAFGLGLAFAGSALANPAMTTVETQMRESPNGHSRVVQDIPPNAQVDVDNCGPVWCSASWRNIPGFVPASAVVPGGVVLRPAYRPPPPVVIAPFGFGFGWGYYRPWHPYY